MNLYTKSLGWLFSISLLLTLFAPVMAPSWKLLFSGPFLITSYYQKSHVVSLWYSFICGVILDLFLSQERFGLYALNLTVTSALLYLQKGHFFADSLSTLPIMTWAFSALSTFIQMILMHGMERDFSFTWQWFLTDIVVMPFFDAIFAFCLFILPFFLFGKQPRRGRDYFTMSEENG